MHTGFISILSFNLKLQLEARFPIIIMAVFFILRLSLIVLSQVLMATRSFWTLLTAELEDVRFVLSAKRRTSKVLHTQGKSFIEIRNSRGPSMEPCETP